MTNDMITEVGLNLSELTKGQFGLFKSYVSAAVEQGYLAKESRGPVLQPNNVRAYCTGDWKVVHYVDPNGVEPDEWELYHLASDPIEQTNLVDFKTGEVRDGVAVTGLSASELKQAAEQLKRELAEREMAVIGTSRRAARTDR